MARKTTSVYTLAPEAPVTLLFLIGMILVAILNSVLPPDFCNIFFSPTKIGGLDPFDWTVPTDYIRLFIHIFSTQYNSTSGNSGFIIANMLVILLLCPVIEELYGKTILILMMITTGFISAIINICFSQNLLAGSDGIICLITILYIKQSIIKKKIPLTSACFALLISAKIGLSISESGYISQLACFTGGVFGSLFGFIPQEKPAPKI